MTGSWSKPAWTVRRGRVKARVSPLTGSAGASFSVGPFRITTGGRVYLFGMRLR